MTDAVKTDRCRGVRRRPDRQDPCGESGAAAGRAAQVCGRCEAARRRQRSPNCTARRSPYRRRDGRCIDGRDGDLFEHRHARRSDPAIGRAEESTCSAKSRSISTLERARAAPRRSKHAGVVCMIGFQRRFDPTFAAFKARIEAGEIGSRKCWW